MSLDRTDAKGFGRKHTTKSNKNLPAGKEVKNKSSDRCTLMTGSTAAGDTLPPHMQFKSVAQAHNQRIDTTGWKYMWYVCGSLAMKQELGTFQRLPQMKKEA